VYSRPFLYLAVCLLSALGAAFAQERQTYAIPIAQKTTPALLEATAERTAWSDYAFAQRAGNTGRKPSSKCVKREANFCVDCGIDVTAETSIPNKTKTPLLACRDMKPGPARLVMETHAEPAISGLWEVEFGLGYKTSAREECPHQFIASNNPPLRPAYEIGPISIESEIPADGVIQVMLCVGLSSAQVGREGRETGASLKISRLNVVSQ
jgi:hypothetical protein